MFENLKANWLTTVIGAGLAGLTLLKTQLELGKIDWPSIVQALLLAGLGLAAKQFNVTGGTKLNGDTSATPLAAKGISASTEAKTVVDNRFPPVK